MARLAGKVALITGAGTGIGSATAKLFAEEGAKVVIAELNKEAGEQVAQVIGQAGGDAIAIPTDVTDPDSIQAAIERCVQHYGALHVLHNNAGGSTFAGQQRDRCADGGILARHQARSVRHVPGLPVRHPGAAEIRRRVGDQHVVERGADGDPGRDCYTAAKGAVTSMTRSMAVEFAPEVRVNAIAPSATMTDRVRKLVAGNAALDKLAQFASAGPDRTGGHRQHGAVPRLR